MTARQTAGRSGSDASVRTCPALPAASAVQAAQAAALDPLIAALTRAVDRLDGTAG